MTSGILLDTHTWLWLQNGELDRPRPVEQALQAALAEDALFACSISMLEIANIVRKGRVSLDMSLADWFESTLRKPGVRLLDTTPSVAIETMNLPPAFHGDPGDRLIAATARVEDLKLLTHDRDLLRFGKHGLMRVLKVDKKRTPNA